MKSDQRPCRVLMIVQNLPVWWDRRVRREATALHRAGCRVSVVCPAPKKKSQKQPLEGVKVYTYPRVWEATSALGYLLEYPWALACISVLSLFVLVRNGFDVIHVANPPDMFFFLAWFYRVIGKKFIYDQHDLCPELYDCKFHRQDWLYRLLVLCERLSYRSADLVLSTNQSYRDIAIKRGRVDEDRLVIVRNGPELEKFHRVSPRLDLKEGFAFMALYVGIMGKQDGADRVVYAAHHLITRHARKDVLFAMVGDGECLEELRQLASRLGIERYLRFTGRISDDELLLQYLSTADVCLSPEPPDLMNQLSTMIKVLEYMACEQPIVSFDLLESRRSAQEAAVYVDGHDPVAFGEAIHELLNDPMERERMRRIGRQRITELAWEPARRSLLDAYSRLFKRPFVDSIDSGKEEDRYKVVGHFAGKRR